MPDAYADPRRHNFCIIYNRVVDDWGEHIGPDGLAAYLAIARFANSATGVAYPSAATLGKRIGMSRRKAVDTLHLLADWGLVRITQRQEQGQQSNLYTLLDLDGVQPVHIPYAQRAYPPMQDMHSPYAPRASEQDVSNKTNKNKRESTPAPADSSDVPYTPNVPMPYPFSGNGHTPTLTSEPATVPVPAPEPARVAPPARVPGRKIVPGEPGTPARVPSPEKVICPRSFPITEDMREWARENAPSVVPQLEAQTKLFLSYYTRGKGAGDRQLNWRGMWETWMLRHVTTYSNGSAPPAKPARVQPDPTDNSSLAQIRARRAAREGAQA